MNYLFAILFIWLVGTSNALKCKFLSTDVTQAESPEEQLMINKTSEAKEYECPAEDKNCVNMKGFLTKIDPETGEQKNMTFGLKSCESDLARLMEPIERTIEQQLNYTCGASSSNENQTAGPITYSLECCSTDDCNVGDNNNNTIEIIFPSEDITDIMQKDEKR
ncbi:hypothetical protein Mgra_00005531 [Meloidogyne graminicola]|uniref:Uncharacterized protein n=1 Tax=Meloidogyne graminicola TaxID=189291 RepID=A0A8S9ZNT5_9BILA|nr:hypothetical protein Mgra_00005531 [Meloidogyne graminicola]